MLKTDLKSINNQNADNFDNVKQANEYKKTENDLFKERNFFNFSKSELLKNLEERLSVTLLINQDDYDNPNNINKFLDTLKKKHDLELDRPQSDSLFKHDKSINNFAKKMENTHMPNGENYTFKFFTYVWLLSRKSMSYQFQDNVLGGTFFQSFSIKDIYYLKTIKPLMFNSLSDVPAGIVKRCKNTQENYLPTADSYIKSFKKIEKAIDKAKQKEQDAVNEEDDSKRAKAENDAQIELYNQYQKINELADTIIEKDMYKSPRTETPSIEEIAQFIVRFVSHAIVLTQDEFKKRLDNGTIVKNENTGSYVLTDQSFIRSRTLDDLYFQNTTNFVWVKAEEIVPNEIPNISHVNNFPAKAPQQVLEKIIQLVNKQSSIQVVYFKEDAIFLQNGHIEYTVNDDGTLNYQFIKLDTKKHHEVMFENATRCRANINFNPTPPKYFDNNAERVKVTPKFIFEDLGKRGFEIENLTDGKSELTEEDKKHYTKDQLKEIEATKHEAEGRANLLKQFFLNAMVFYKDFDIFGKRFLLLYNAANSGKSTFMKLLLESIGVHYTSSLDISDLDTTKTPFGTVNLKGKFLVNADEISDSTKTKIDSKLLKKVSVKDRVDANQKGKEYTSFVPEASIILASNSAPRFTDESDGTRRRMLAFKLNTGLQISSRDTDKPKDLKFIKDKLILQDDFKSACLIHVLETVNVNTDIPKSVEDDAQTIIAQESDVKDFFQDFLRPRLKEVTYLTIDDLFELYSFFMGVHRPKSIARGEKSFKLALEKGLDGIYLPKSRPMFSRFDSLNQLLGLYLYLFKNQIARSYDKNLEKNALAFFERNCFERQKALEKFYDELTTAKANDEITKKRSKIGAKQMQFCMILPSNDEYNDFIKDTNREEILKTLNKIRNQRQKHMVNLACKDDNLSIITKYCEHMVNTQSYTISDEMEQISKNLPLPLRAIIPSDLAKYTTKESEVEFDNSISYSDFFIKL